MSETIEFKYSINDDLIHVCELGYMSEVKVTSLEAHMIGPELKKYYRVWSELKKKNIQHSEDSLFIDKDKAFLESSIIIRETTKIRGINSTKY